MKTINAKSNVCSDPVAKTKAEADRGETELEVLLDNPVFASNVMRLLESKGFGVQLKDDEGTITISARKGEPPHKAAALTKQPAGPVYETQPISRPQIAAPYQTPAPATQEPPGTFSVLITRRALGSDAELGEVLMKNFLGALSRAERPPLTVALMNEGIKLARYDSSSCDHLKNLEKKGVSILVCGTCANYFNVMDQIGAGSISDMPEIIEAINKAGKIITL